MRGVPDGKPTCDRKKLPGHPSSARWQATLVVGWFCCCGSHPVAVVVLLLFGRCAAPKTASNLVSSKSCNMALVLSASQHPHLAFGRSQTLSVYPPAAVDILFRSGPKSGPLATFVYSRPPRAHTPILYRFGDATQVAYSFWLYDLCDTYLELIKPVVGDMSDGNKQVNGWWFIHFLSLSVRPSASVSRSCPTARACCNDVGAFLSFPFLSFL